MFFANVATILINSIDKLMIGAYISVEAVGVYTIASVFVVFLRSIGKGFAKIGQPLISEYWRTNDKAGIEKVYKENLNLQLFLGIFVFLCFVAFGQEVLKFIGKDYAGGYFVLVIIAFGELINIGTGLCGAIINYSSKYKFELFSKIFLIIVAVS